MHLLFIASVLVYFNMILYTCSTNSVIKYSKNDQYYDFSHQTLHTVGPAELHFNITLAAKGEEPAL